MLYAYLLHTILEKIQFQFLPFILATEKEIGKGVGKRIDRDMSY